MADKRIIPKQPKKPVKPRTSGQRRLHLALWLLGLTLVLVALSIGLYFLNQSRAAAIAPGMGTTPAEQQPKNGLLRVREVTVTGNSHYTADQIIGVSGIYVGQSIWNVNKTQAVANIKAHCPYVENAKITSGLTGKYTIAVTETTVIGAMYNNGNWVLVGEDGRAVDQFPAETQAPSRYFYFKGATPGSGVLGEQAMDDRCTEIANECLASIKDHELTGICELDLSNKGNLSLNWNNQITILLGNDSNLDYEISVIKEVLPTVLKNHGQQAKGTLDVSSYSDENATNRAVFTPDN